MAAFFDVSHSDSSPIFGRKRELVYLRSLIEGLPERGAVLLVRGEAGVGKSVLLSATGRRAEAAGMRVLRTTGVQSEAELAFAGLHQLLLPLSGGIDRLPHPQRTALLTAFGMAETPEAPDRFLIGLAVLELLSDAAERVPVLVLADDAQWIDPSTASILGFVARRIEHEPICLLLSIRSGATDPFAEYGLPEVVLDGLDDATAGLLLAAHGHDFAPEVRRRLLEQTGGNPLALIELPKVLGRDEREGTSSLPIPLPLTTRLEQAFTAQSATLPPATRSLLLLAAAADSESTLDEILEASQVMAGEVPLATGFAPAIAAGLIEITEPNVAFRHPLVRSAIYQAASLVDRRAAHAAYVEVLTEKPDRRVWHQAAALVGANEGVAEALEGAAWMARRRGASGTAIRALERSAGLSENGRFKVRRLLQASELAFETGRREMARRLITEVQRFDLSAAERQQIFFMRHWFSDEVRTGDTGLDRIEAAAKHGGLEGNQIMATNVLLFTAMQSFATSAGMEVRKRILHASVELALRPDDARLVAIHAFAAPVSRGAAIIETLSRISPVDGSDAEVARLLGFAACAVGAFELAVSFLDVAVDALRAHGQIAVLAKALVMRANAHWNLDRWDLAACDADEGHRLSEETGQLVWAAGALTYKSRVAAARGEVGQVEALAESVERHSLPMGNRFHLTHVQWVRGYAALGEGRNENAYEHFIRAFRTEDPAWHYSERHFMIGDLAEAARHAGHLEEVRALLRETAAAITEMASPAGRIAVAFARAMLANENEAEELFERALLSVRTRKPFIRARLQLAYGTWLRRERRVVESRSPLRAAREIFDALGASGWAERARGELRASGIESRPRERNALEYLTPQELQIAHLAASGLSNREIGGRLLLSHRTVGAHLYRAFPKLGITSRGQLREVLGLERR